MLDTFDGVISRWVGGRFQRPRPAAPLRKHRVRTPIQVELLEPRCLLSVLGPNPDDTLDTSIVPVDTSSDNSTSDNSSADDSTSYDVTFYDPTTGDPSEESILIPSAIDDALSPSELTVTGLETARALPDISGVQTVRVSGRDPIFYSVSVDSATSAFELDLTSTRPGTPVMATMSILDPDGQPIVTALPTPNSRSSTLSLYLPANSVGLGSSFVIEVSPQPGSAVKSIDDTLSITRFLDSSHPTGFSPEAVLSGSNDQTTQTGDVTIPDQGSSQQGWSPPAGASDTSPHWGSQADVPRNGDAANGMLSTFSVPTGFSADRSITIGSLPVAVGPLPARSAAPMAGVLAEGDPIPPVAPIEAVRVNLAAMPAMTDPSVVPQLRPINPTDSPSPERNAAVIVLRGRGGLPLLATSLIGEIVVRDGVALPVIDPEPGATSPVPSTTSLPQTVTLSEPAPEAASCSDAEKSETRRPARRFSALPGLTAVLAVGLGLVVPDLVGAFQFSSRPRRRFRMVRMLRASRLRRIRTAKRTARAK